MNQMANAEISGIVLLVAGLISVSIVVWTTLNWWWWSR